MAHAQDRDIPTTEFKIGPFTIQPSMVRTMEYSMDMVAQSTWALHAKVTLYDGTTIHGVYHDADPCPSLPREKFPEVTPPMQPLEWLRRRVEEYHAHNRK